MLFFAGYGSILPYLLYLSVVWVCILIGVKGDVWKIFKSADNCEQISISNTSDDNYFDAFILSMSDESYQVKEKNSHSIYTSTGDYLFWKSDHFIRWTVFVSNWQPSFRSSSISLRGPPGFFL